MFGLRDRLVRQPMLDVVHFGLDVEERLKRRADFLEDGAAAVTQAVLRQVPDRQRRRLDDVPGVGLVEAAEHLEQGGLAGAVRSAQADTLAVSNLPRNVVQEDAIAEGLGKVGKLNHAGREPWLPVSSQHTKRAAGSLRRVARLRAPWRRRREPAAHGTA